MEQTAPELMASFFNARAQTYDEAYTGRSSGGCAAKDLPAQFLPEGTRDILDLGCGTGLELPAIFARFPHARVLGIDLANEMLAQLRARCAGRNVQTLCMSFFDYAYPPASFDAVISVMALHHFSPEQKLGLYRDIFVALRPGGVFVSCDYMIDDPREVRRDLEEMAKLGIAPGKYHIDLPLTAGIELRLLRQTGFKRCALLWKSGNTKVVRGCVKSQ